MSDHSPTTTTTPITNISLFIIGNLVMDNNGEFGSEDRDGGWDDVCECWDRCFGFGLMFECRKINTRVLVVFI